jgi:hypothetical protein
VRRVIGVLDELMLSLRRLFVCRRLSALLRSASVVMPGGNGLLSPRSCSREGNDQDRGRDGERPGHGFAFADHGSRIAILDLYAGGSRQSAGNVRH